MDSREYFNLYEKVNITVDEAVRLIRDDIDKYINNNRADSVEMLPILESVGRITAKDCISSFDNPPFPRSPLDGYAFRASDSTGASPESPVALKVITEVDAGDYYEGTVGPGEAVRIMTGAPIPAGADCVIRQEDTDYGEEAVSIYKELKVFDNYCYAGEDFKEGTCLIPKGTKITAIEVGIMASMGMSYVEVVRAPKVAVFSTGDELTDPSESLAKGKIYNSNMYLLVARLKELGINVCEYGHLGDDSRLVAEKIDAIAGECDLIITTGGVSVGKKDIMHEALDMVKANRIFWRVKLKPGMPTIYSRVKNAAVLALSGNPYGAAVNLELLGREALAAISGDETISMTKGTAELQNDFLKGGGVTRYVRAFHENGKVYIKTNKHSSGVLASMQGCNCLIEVTGGSEGAKDKDRVTIYHL